MKKGISPLIGAVILMAFVITVGVLVSVFFRGTTRDWTRGVGEESPIECALMDIEILSASATPDNATVSYWSSSSEIKEGVVLNVYHGDSLLENVKNEKSLTKAESANITVEDLDLSSNDTVELQLQSLDCTGKSVTKEVEV
mgnify:CR=1 FL=1